MRGLIIILALLAIPFAALADDASTVTYSSPDKAFSLSFPSAGTLKDASDPDWDHGSTTVLTWEATADKAPLSFVTANVVSFLDAAGQHDVDDFMRDELSDKNLADVKAELESKGDPITLGGHVWSNARFKYTEPKLDGEYEVFVTFEGDNVYAFYCEYSLGTTGGDADARSILASFMAPTSYT